MRAILGLFVLALGSLAATAAQASIPPDIPMVQRLGVGARALGMGGAHAAVADDASALYYNPAGLAKLGDVEFSGAVQQRRYSTDVDYGGSSESTPVSKSRIQSWAFAYPFPTWRGGLGIGISYNRVTDLDAEYFRTGTAPGIAFEEESILEDGSLGAWQAGLGLEVSPSLALGLTGTILAGSSRRERSFLFDEAGGPDYEQTSTITELDLTAISGSFGALYNSGPFQLGLVLHLPENFTLEGTATEDVRRYEVDGDTLDYYDFYNFKDEVTLPFRTSLGLAWRGPAGPGELILAGGWDYTDWQQIDYAGPIRTDDRGYAYRATSDLRFGAEYAFQGTPLRLRAGLIRQPVAYRLIATDVFRGVAGESDFETERRYLTAGAGVQLDPSFGVDAAFLTGSFTRSGRSSTGVETREEVTDRRVYLGATFRL